MLLFFKSLKKGVSQRITVENCAHRNRITSASQRITVKKQHIRHTHVPGWSYPAYTAGAGVGPSCARSGHCRSWRGGRLARGSAQAGPGAAIAGAGAGAAYLIRRSAAWLAAVAVCCVARLPSLRGPSIRRVGVRQSGKAVPTFQPTFQPHISTQTQN